MAFPVLIAWLDVGCGTGEMADMCSLPITKEYIMVVEKLSLPKMQRSTMSRSIGYLLPRRRLRA